MPSYDLSIKQENLVKHNCDVPAGYVKLLSVISKLPTYSGDEAAKEAGLRDCDIYSWQGRIAVVGDTTRATGANATGNSLDIAFPKEEVIKQGCGPLPRGYVTLSSVLGRLPVYNNDERAVEDGLKACDAFLKNESGDAILEFVPSPAPAGSPGGAESKEIPYFDVAVPKDDILYRNCNIPRGYITLSQIISSLPVYEDEAAARAAGLIECDMYLRRDTRGNPAFLAIVKDF
jgi:hypothetical protein